MSAASPITADFRPDDPEPFTEVIDGRLVEMPPMGTESVWVVSRIHFRIAAFADEHAPGSVVGEMLFTLRKSPLLRRRPDVAFVSADRWALDRPIPRDNGWEVVPDLAVEVVSPTDPIEDVMDRIHDFLAAGSVRVWLVFPKTRQVYVYESPTSIRVLGPDAQLNGEAVLPGFTCPVSSIFPPVAGPSTRG